MKEIELKLGVEINVSDVTIAQRIPTKTKSSKQPIIVRFNNWFKKGEMVHKSKALRRSKNSGEVEEVENTFYINEQLTEHTSHLYKKARTLGDERRVQYAWLKNGKVFVKAYDNTETIRIKDYREVEKIRIQFQPEPIPRTNSQKSDKGGSSAYARKHG